MLKQIKTFEICFFIAFCISALLMPFAARFSIRLRAVSEVGGRHVGGVPIGRLGGVGVITALIVAILIINQNDESVFFAFSNDINKVIGLMIGLALVGGIGFWDDIRRLSAIVKLGVQLIGGIFAYGFGLRISGLDLPFVEPFQLGYLGLPFTLFWIIGVVNAVNLIDGLDGLAGGVVLFAAIVNFVAAITSESVISAALMSAVAGGVLGFLLYNWHPAKIYLGDGGAYSLGFVLAACSLIAPNHKATTCVSLLIPVLAAGLPIFDTVVTLVRRFLNGRGLFSPDRGHLHHVLLDAGISHRRVVIGLYTLSSVLCSAALVIVLNRNRDIGLAVFIASVIGSVFWGISTRAHLRDALRNALLNNRFTDNSGCDKK